MQLRRIEMQLRRSETLEKTQVTEIKSNANVY